MSEAKKFAWNEETTATAVERYVELRGDGVANADACKTIGMELGTTLQSVRSKLASQRDAQGEKVYQKDETPRKVGGASSIRKLQIVGKIADALELDRDDLESLEKASKAHLETLLAGITGEDSDEE